MNTNLTSAVKAAALPFLLSRMLIASIVLCGVLVRIDGVPAREGTIFHAYVSLQASGAAERLKNVMLAGDASWYLHLARYGYTHHVPGMEDVPHNWVFFPLFPLIVRCLETLFGSPLICAAVLSNVAFFAGLCLLYLLVLELPLRREQQHAALWFCAFFPTSYFYSGAFTESLFFLLVTAWLILLSRNRLLAAGSAFSFAAACRPTGLLLFPAFFCELARRWKEHKRGALLAAAIAPLCLISFMLHLRSVAGDPLAFIKNQTAWGRRAGWDAIYVDLIERQLLARDWSFNLLHITAAFFAGYIGLRLARERRFTLALMLIVPLAVLAYSGTLISLTRIVMPLPALAVGFAELADSEFKRTTWLIFSAALLALLTLCWSQLFTIAMT